MKSAIGLVLLFVALSYAEEYAMDDGTPDRHPYVVRNVRIDTKNLNLSRHNVEDVTLGT